MFLVFSFLVLQVRFVLEEKKKEVIFFCVWGSSLPVLLMMACGSMARVQVIILDRGEERK